MAARMGLGLSDIYSLERLSGGDSRCLARPILGTFLRMSSTIDCNPLQLEIWLSNGTVFGI
jgi:hypothetical protein